MIAVARDHFPELFDAVLDDFRCWLISHALESVGAPGGHFRLNQNAVAVAVFENAPVLLPMNARKHTIQLF